MLEVKRKDGETPAALMFRFTKKMRQSGIMKEVRKRRFYSRNENKRKRANSAQYRAGKAEELREQKKLGMLS